MKLIKLDSVSEQTDLKMQEQKFYYKLMRNDNSEEFYVKTDLPVKPEIICKMFGVDDTWHAECITEEEYYFEDE